MLLTASYLQTDWGIYTGKARGLEVVRLKAVVVEGMAAPVAMHVLRGVAYTGILKHLIGLAVAAVKVAMAEVP